MSDFKAYGYNIAIKKEARKETTESGLYIPEEAKDLVNIGLVVSVGEGMLDPATNTRVGVEIKVGARVCYRSKVGYLIKVGGDELLILRPDDILGELV